VHNAIATSLTISLGSQLRGKRCQAFNSDTKVRVRIATQTRFYYPDGMVVCQPNPAGDTFQDRPVVVAEVISESTRRIDEGEKLDAYLTIPTLSAYLLIETASPRVVVYQRSGDAGGFVAQLYEGVEAVVPLDAIGTSLPLADLYERVDFTEAAAEDQPPEE
jgi:Uma2 family endonuclease